LILPFAYLVHQQLDTVVTLLEGIVVPGQGSAPARAGLEVLLTSWCDNVDVFQGYWNLKVRYVESAVPGRLRGESLISLCLFSSVALTQLFLSQRPSLGQIQVKGELLLTAANSNAIMTRARAKNSASTEPSFFSSEVAFGSLCPLTLNSRSRPVLDDPFPGKGAQDSAA
jgi:hypothetical protein